MNSCFHKNYVEAGVMIVVTHSRHNVHDDVFPLELPPAADRYFYQNL